MKQGCHKPKPTTSSEIVSLYIICSSYIRGKNSSHVGHMNARTAGRSRMCKRASHGQCSLAPDISHIRAALTIVPGCEERSPYNPGKSYKVWKRRTRRKLAATRPKRFPSFKNSRINTLKQKLEGASQTERKMLDEMSSSKIAHAKMETDAQRQLREQQERMSLERNKKECELHDAKTHNF
jgi:hypothetical protein